MARIRWINQWCMHPETVERKRVQCRAPSPLRARTWGSIHAHLQRLKRHFGEESAFFLKTTFFYFYRGRNK